MDEQKTKIDVGETTEFAVSWDTTGSMSPCLQAVRNKIEETIEEMFSNIQGLKVGLIAHGDYCDGDAVITILPLTDDKTKIYNFVRHTPPTGGGDAPECYELALHEARNLGWTEGVDSGRALVLIGDDEPHPPDYELNSDKLDWTSELMALREMGVKVYPLQCLYNPSRIMVNQFWSQVAELSGTPLLKLSEFSESDHALKGVAFAAAGEDAYAAYEARAVNACMHFSAETVTNTEVLRKEAEKFTAARHMK
jgi:hypothetical protein